MTLKPGDWNSVELVSKTIPVSSKGVREGYLHRDAAANEFNMDVAALMAVSEDFFSWTPETTPRIGF